MACPLPDGLVPPSLQFCAYVGTSPPGTVGLGNAICVGYAYLLQLQCAWPRSICMYVSAVLGDAAKIVLGCISASRWLCGGSVCVLPSKKVGF